MVRKAFYCLIFNAAIFVMMTPAGLCEVLVKTQSEAVLFGAGDLKKAVIEANIADMTVLVAIKPAGEDKVIAAAAGSLPAKPESFVIARSDSAVVIVGSDEVGAMYGCFELAERLRMEGKKALDIDKPIIQSPYVEFRAVNPFLTLPYGNENMDTWWFLSDDFWQGYIDQLARARINWIDLHGMYDIKTTEFPNLYAYFIKSDRFPDAGVAPDIADRNLEMLKKVMRMAKNHGIKFAVMNYSTYDGNYCRKNSYKWTEDEMAEYTRECARKFIQSCPDMLMFGFRIGESGKGEDFFRKNCIPAIQEAGRDIVLYTRAWGTSKEKVIEIAQAFPGRLYVEIKYNGEQYGPAHIVAGGRMAGWDEYSYTDYFTYPQPYKVIFQVRANGTHRVFPWGNPDFAARTARNSLLGGSIGFCVEPVNAYYPAYDYLHKDDSELRWYKWIYQRDWLFYDLWGRMSYDPNVSEQVWIAKFKDRFGNGGQAFYNAFITASQIIPYAKMFYTQGPDHRDYATELETGGSVVQWAKTGPFDGQNVQSPMEYAESVVNKQPSARLNPIQAADILDKFSGETIKQMGLAKKASSDSKEFKSLCVDMEMLSYLGRYNASRLRSAAYYSLYSLSHDRWAADMSRNYHKNAVKDWGKLAALGQMYFKPFVDTLRLKTEEFTWAKEAQKCRVDGTSLDEQILPLEKMSLPKDALLPKGDRTGPTIKIAAVLLETVSQAEKRLAIKVDINDPAGVKKAAALLEAINQTEKKLTIKADVDDPAGVKSVLLKYKPLPSETDWKTIELTKEAALWVGSVSVSSDGLMWCIEAIDKDGNGAMWPDFRNDIPYRVVESWDKSKADN